MNNKNIIYGLHAVQSLIAKTPDRIVKIIFAKERHDRVMQDMIHATKNKSQEFVSRKELDDVTSGENHQGVVVFVKSGKIFQESDIETLISQAQKPLLLILDAIQDPHNLGACLRSADAAGVTAVIAPKDKSVGLTGTAIKVASGAADNVPFIQVTNLARTLRELKELGIWIFGAAGEADKNLYEADFSVPLAIVLGSEGKGMRRLTREHCDLLLKIPMDGSVSSLNVSVAAGIFLFEAVRQRT